MYSSTITLNMHEYEYDYFRMYQVLEYDYITI